MSVTEILSVMEQNSILQNEEDLTFNDDIEEICEDTTNELTKIVSEEVVGRKNPKVGEFW